MEQLPEFWRTEIFHPLSVHFPIALLCVALLFKLISLFTAREMWTKGGSVLLFLGTLGAWVAIYTGDLADGIVSRKICDPTVLKEHQNFAYYTAWTFTASLLPDLFSYFKQTFLQQKRKLLNILTVLLMAAGTALLIYVGHLGANLVYQQGAGVYHPDSDCSGFE